MRRVPLDRVDTGAVLGKTLYNERGDVLLRRGAELSPRYLDLLREKGFGTVYLHDPDTEDIDLDDVVSEHVRESATKNIYRFQQVVEKGKACGAHNLSGAMMRPSGLQELFPDSEPEDWPTYGAVLSSLGRGRLCANFESHAAMVAS